MKIRRAFIVPTYILVAFYVSTNFHCLILSNLGLIILFSLLVEDFITTLLWTIEKDGEGKAPKGIFGRNSGMPYLWQLEYVFSFVQQLLLSLSLFLIIQKYILYLYLALQKKPRLIPLRPFLLITKSFAKSKSYLPF